MTGVNFRIFGVLVLTAAISSCGGGEVQSGIFSDSPVSGLAYTTPSQSGVTDGAGTFFYREGETVVFSIGNLALPVVAASTMVTPLDMVASDDVMDPGVVNIARLLQSLDADSNPENGIAIPEVVGAVFTETAVFDATDERAVFAVVEQAYGGQRLAVSADQAMEHFVSSLSANVASDGELQQLSYLVPAGDVFVGDSLFVDQSNFTLTIDGEVHTGAASVNHGVYQLEGADKRWFVSVDDAKDNQRACIAKAPTSIADCDASLYNVFVEEQRAMEFSVVEDSVRAEENTASEEALSIGAATDEVDAIDAASSNSTELTLAELFPECESVVVDDDGDGFGWENNASCLIVIDDANVAEGSATETTNTIVPVQENTQPVSAPEATPAPAPGTELTLAELFPECESVVVDDNGDGFGWENNASCLIVIDDTNVAEGSATETTNTIVPVQENTQPVSAPEAIPAPVPEVAPTPAVEETPTPAQEATPALVTEVTAAPTPVDTGISASDITDIIVLTGQSNAAAVETGFDATLDAGHERLMAFNEDGQWRAAGLNQFWDANLPSNFASAADGRDPYNNLAFQVGKALTAQSDRVVGIIMVTAPGEGISHWDYNTEMYVKIRSKVTAALAQLPQKTSVDAMIWMQGETDWLAEGTADPGATGFVSTDSDFYRDYYPNKLEQLISNLRSESWYGFDAQFICGETKKTNLNHHLMALNDDADDLTSCAAASDLPTRVSDPFDNHYSADGLRTLGGRIADLYILAAD